MAETAQQKVDKDLKTLPKSVPTPKPLNYTGNPDPEVQGTRFGNLELRAELDSRMVNNPIVRLGYDIIERGVLDPTAGEMGGEIRALFNISDEIEDRDTLYGLALPGDILNVKGRGNTDTVRKIFAESGTDFSDRIGTVPRDLEVMGRGVASLLPPSRGSTVMYEADQMKREIKDTGQGEAIVKEQGTIDDDYNLNTLAEELAHIGIKELARRGVDIGRLSEEEAALAVMRAQMSASHGMTPSSSQQYFLMQDLEKGKKISGLNLLGEFNEAAEAVLAERGVPPRAKRRDTKEDSGMVSSMLKFFGVN